MSAQTVSLSIPSRGRPTCSNRQKIFQSSITLATKTPCSSSSIYYTLNATESGLKVIAVDANGTVLKESTVLSLP